MQAIGILKPMQNPVDVAQMLGRALRIDADNPEKIAYFMLPYFVDETEDAKDDAIFFSEQEPSELPRPAKRTQGYAWSGPSDSNEQIAALKEWFIAKREKAAKDGKKDGDQNEMFRLIEEIKRDDKTCQKLRKRALAAGFEVWGDQLTLIGASIAYGVGINYITTLGDSEDDGGFRALGVPTSHSGSGQTILLGHEGERHWTSMQCNLPSARPWGKKKGSFDSATDEEKEEAEHADLLAKLRRKWTQEALKRFVNVETLGGSGSLKDIADSVAYRVMEANTGKYEKRWERMFQLVKEYKEEHGGEDWD
eukprot:g8863.t1